MAIADWRQPDAARLADRLHKYDEELLAFMCDGDIPPDHNAAERAIRPAVLIRKNSYANHRDRGALTAAVLMSICRTLRQRHLDPLATLLQAINQLATTGPLPTLPSTTSEG